MVRDTPTAVGNEIDGGPPVNQLVEIVLVTRDVTGHVHEHNTRSWARYVLLNTVAAFRRNL